MNYKSILLGIIVLAITHVSNAGVKSKIADNVIDILNGSKRSSALIRYHNINQRFDESLKSAMREVVAGKAAISDRKLFSVDMSSGSIDAHVRTLRLADDRIHAELVFTSRTSEFPNQTDILAIQDHIAESIKISQIDIFNKIKKIQNSDGSSSVIIRLSVLNEINLDRARIVLKKLYEVNQDGAFENAPILSRSKVIEHAAQGSR